MQIIYANFDPAENFEAFFSKYKDEVGNLFQNGNQILSEADYTTLYCKMANKAQWSTSPRLQPQSFDQANRNKNCFENENEKKYFYRCFGIYLREATMRYGKDLAGESAFWTELNEGIQQDLNDAYKKINSEERRKKGFWEDASPQDELTKNQYYVDGKSRLAYIFSFFENPAIRNIEKKDNVHQYMRHLIRMAICPINYNPLRSRYAEVLENANHVETLINATEKNSLDIHPKMRATLTGRISNFFRYLPHIRNLYQSTNPEQRNHFIADNACKFFNLENQNHYYIDWLRQDLQGVQRYIPQTRRQPAQQNAQQLYEDYNFVVSFNTINQSINITAPSDLNLDELFGKELGLEPWEEYQITNASGESLLTIQNSQVIKGSNKDLYNAQVLKLLSEEKINISGGDLNTSIIKNPWYTTSNPYFIFDKKGKLQKHSVKLSEPFFLVLPHDEQIISIEQAEGNHVEQLEDASYQEKDGLSLYEINVGTVDSVTITTTNGHLSRSIYLSVYDPTYLRHYESEEANQATVFMVQRRTHKIGIGTIAFSLPGDIANPTGWLNDFNARHQGDGISAHIDTDINRAPRLIISNEAHRIIEIPEQKFSETKNIPKISLLPQGTVFWTAKRKGDANFSAFLKCPNDIRNLDRQRWTQEGTIFRYNINDKEWIDSGRPVSFIQNGFTILTRTPYWNDAINHEIPYAEDFFWGNNPFDDLIPTGAKWAFQWEECNRTFRVTTSTNNSISKCAESLELEGNYPDVYFGWTFENTEFLLSLSKKEGKYKLPSRAPEIYEKTDAERSTWLENLITRDRPALKNYARNLSQRFGIDYNDSISDNCNDETDVKHAIGKKFFDKHIADGCRKDLINYQDEQKFEWIENWLSVSDWDGLLKILLRELNTRNDSLYKTLSSGTDEYRSSFIKNFSSREDVYDFVNNRYIPDPLKNKADDLIRLNSLQEYKSEIYHKLSESNLEQLANNFDNTFNAIAIEFKKEQYKKIWQSICIDGQCDNLAEFIYFPEELKNASNITLEQFAKKVLVWIDPLFNVIQNIEFLEFYIPRNFNRISNKLSEDDISLLANRYATGIQKCIKDLSDSGIEFDHTLVSSFFNITEGSFSITAQNNHNFDYSGTIKDKTQKYIQEQKNAPILANLRQQVQQALENKPGYFEQITEEMFENYVDNGGDCNDIFAFLEFVNKTTPTIFQNENRTWKNNCLGFGVPKIQVPPVPGKCLLMANSKEIIKFMREFFRKD